MISQGLYDHDTMHIFFDHKHYQQHATVPKTARQDSETCPWASIRGDTSSVKKLFGWWNPVMPLAPSYTTRLLD
jgi:hypothetical protein